MSRARDRHSIAILALVLALGGAGLVAILAPGSGDPSSSGPRRACTVTVGGTGAARKAAASARPGSVVCLRNGSYGALALDARKRPPGVLVRARDPGQATLEAADLSGSNLSLARFDVAGQITIEPGSKHISVLHNRISGGYFGLEAGPTTTTSISDTTVRGNLFVGPFGEDAIRLNRYHDGADRDPYGVLIEENEITGVRENGNHSDCLQSVWGGDGLYFRRNYLHDNRCQGFFVKDQPAPVARIVVQDNLLLRNLAPCDPPSLDCGPPVIVHVFGPAAGVRLTRNTVWTRSERSPVALREGPFGRIAIERNVIFRAWSDWTGGFPDFLDSENVYCQWEGTLPRPSRDSGRSCSPGFRNPAADDYRLRAAHAPGVTWAPAEEHYGP